jgi:hypothetical protein
MRQNVIGPFKDKLNVRRNVSDGVICGNGGYKSQTGGRRVSITQAHNGAGKKIALWAFPNTAKSPTPTILRIGAQP